MKKSPGLRVLPVPVPKIDHPEPPNAVLPKHEFTIGLIAPKGSGKTTLIANLLHFYAGYFNDIFVFSPTVLSDVLYQELESCLLYTSPSPRDRTRSRMPSSA